MRVLLVEDDISTSQAIDLFLKSEGFNVYTTDMGEEGIQLGKLYDYDIVILDINLPDISGWQVLKSLREAKVKTPVLILSGLAAIEDKVRGLSLGADDYMTKPFHRDELVARIYAVVRRSKGHAQSLIQIGDLLINLGSKVVEVGGQRVHLTGKEYQMLESLALRSGTVVTKEMLLNQLYGGMDEPDLKIIGVFICKLRKKLMALGGSGFDIETVWGRGFMLMAGDDLSLSTHQSWKNIEDIDLESMIKSYNDGATVKEVAASHGVEHWTVGNRLRAAGVTLRPRGRSTIQASRHAAKV